jgi:hypothetical protein
MLKHLFLYRVVEWVHIRIYRYIDENVKNGVTKGPSTENKCFHLCEHILVKDGIEG